MKVERPRKLLRDEEADTRRMVEGLLHGHDLSMDEYAWPTSAEVPAELRDRRWAATVAALPLGASIVGTVIGRQPFGVFIRVDGVPDAMALAEITVMPQGMGLPEFGARVLGEVIDHAEHNHQVRVLLLEWAAPAG